MAEMVTEILRDDGTVNGMGIILNSRHNVIVFCVAGSTGCNSRACEVEAGAGYFRDILGYRISTKTARSPCPNTRHVG